MKKNKGFTLIELLAVIVVLAVIALIATPIVLNLVNNARKGAAEASAYAYVKEVETYIMLSQINPNLVKLEDGKTYEVSKIKYEEIVFIDLFIDRVYAEEISEIYLNDLIDMKGEKPASGKVTIEDNGISEAKFVVKGYNVYCDKKICKTNGKSKVEQKELKIELGSVTTKHDTITIPFTINEDADEDVDIKVYYGETEALGNEAVCENNKCEITGLTEKTTYYYKVVAKDTFGNEVILPSDTPTTITTPVRVYTLSEAIMRDNPNVLTSIKYSSPTQDASGLYKSTATNSGKPTYYFRNIVNNYVTFAGKSWSIIRINEDGTVRLILNSTKSGSADVKVDGGFAANNTDYKYVYYSNSIAKPYLENWFKTNLSSVSNKIATGDYFCEQAKVSYYSNGTLNNATLPQYKSYSPNFNCKPDANGYGPVNSNIGLINYDEAAFAGVYYGASSLTYLEKNSNYTGNTLTMSPSHGATQYVNNAIFRLYKSDKYTLTTTGTGSTGYIYLRPVINLKADVTISTGNGSSGTPYVIS